MYRRDRNTLDKHKDFNAPILAIKDTIVEPKHWNQPTLNPITGDLLADEENEKCKIEKQNIKRQWIGSWCCFCAL